MGWALEAVLAPNHSDFLGRNEDLRRVADAIRGLERMNAQEEQKTSSASSPLVLLAGHNNTCVGGSSNIR